MVRFRAFIEHRVGLGQCSITWHGTDDSLGVELRVFYSYIL